MRAPMRRRRANRRHREHDRHLDGDCAEFANLRLEDEDAQGAEGESAAKTIAK